MSSVLVFLSYSHANKEFANRLKTNLQNLGLSVWQDYKDIKPGDSISENIEQALRRSDYFILIFSDSSISSKWLRLEYRTALHSQIEKGKPRIIPILFHDVDLPEFRGDVRYVDFVQGYHTGWTTLETFFRHSELRAIKVGGGTGTGFYLLNLIIARLRERFPSLPIQKRIDISEELIKAVASDEMEVRLDLAIVGKKPDKAFRQNLEYQEIFRDTNILTVFPGHPLWGKKSISEYRLWSLLKQGTSFIGRSKDSGQ